MYAEIIQKFATEVRTYNRVKTEEAFSELENTVAANESSEFVELFEKRTLALFEVLENWACGIFSICDTSMSACDEKLGEYVIRAVTHGNCFQVKFRGLRGHEEDCLECSTGPEMKYWFVRVKR